MTSATGEIEPGYFELRVNWSASDLIEMEPERFARLKSIIEEVDDFFGRMDDPVETPEPKETPNP